MPEDTSQKEILNKIAKLIRSKAKNGEITTIEDIKELKLELSEEEILDKIEVFKEEANYPDIRILSGEKSKYLFTDNDMTKKYAKIMAKIEEDNIKGSIAKTVREDSKIYPRPTDVTVFKKSPFYLDDDVLDKIIKQMETNEEYEDIKQVEASNGALYLYSDEYMEKDHAVGLTEWVEVIRKEIP